MPYPSNVDYGFPVESGKYLHIPQGWDDAWVAAKRNITSQRVGVTVIGDSITQGWNASDIMIDSYYARLRAAILAANGNLLGGDYYGIIYDSVVESAIGSPSTAVHPMTINGVRGVDWDYYLSGYSAQALNYAAKTPFITVTPPYSVTGFDMIFDDYASGTWTYGVDSGSTTNVVCTGAGAASGDGIIKKVSVSGLTSGTHTLKINAPSTAVVCNIFGATAYTGTTGLCFANMAWPGMGLVAGGSSTNKLSDQSTVPVDRIALYQGFQGTTASPTALSGFGFPAQPDLAVIALGVNDAYHSATLSDFKNALKRLVWSLRFGKNDACSIIIVAMWIPDGTAASANFVTNTDFTALGGADSYYDLKIAMLEIAQTYNCAFVDVHSAFGRKTVANGWTTATDIHPTSTGHQVIANLLSAIV